MEDSFAILHAVSMTMETNPHIGLVEVQGHTDERGSEAYNLDLSQRRAQSVVNFLVKDGVAEKRLEAQGYGESQPKIRKSNEQAWAANRRVEFIILDN
jgi:outer membrane protein OmpA-like peptidoglycan-associated protein